MTLTVTPETWIIADTHFGHHNIIRYCNRPVDHDAIMQRRWKRIVRKNDVVLHLGDVAVWYGFATTWAKRAGKLPGKKYLIRGNHDEHFDDKKWATFGFEVIPPFRQGDVYFSHEPLRESEELWSVNIHGHSHNHAPYGVYTSLSYTYYNASIEGMKYRPVRLGQILQEVASA